MLLQTLQREKLTRLREKKKPAVIKKRSSFYLSGVGEATKDFGSRTERPPSIENLLSKRNLIRKGCSVAVERWPRDLEVKGSNRSGY